jgi:hypothetical protein
MIVLTGDVHHMSLKTRDQRYLQSCTEPETALQYVEIANRHNLKVTLFVTGKAISEEPVVFREICNFPNVELGGHNYYAFRPRWLYNGLFFRVLRRSNGPAWYQNWEIENTRNIFQQILGIDIQCWRDHGYRHDCNTNRLLEMNEIQVVSNEVNNYGRFQKILTNLYSLPINVLPDHDHLYHGTYTKNNLISPERYVPEKWLEHAISQTDFLVKSGEIATLLVHPTCMKIADNFMVFDRLCKYIRKYTSVFVSDLVK